MTLDVSEYTALNEDGNIKGLQVSFDMSTYKGAMLLAQTEQGLKWWHKAMYLSHKEEVQGDDDDDEYCTLFPFEDDRQSRRLRFGLRCNSMVKMDRATCWTQSSIEFNEDTCLTLRGKVRLPIGEDFAVEEVGFGGFRIRDAGFRIPRPWTNYPAITFTRI